MMPRTRIHLALALLLAAAAPLRAQSAPTRLASGGSFKIEVPAGLPALELLNVTEHSGQRSEFFASRTAERSVIVQHTQGMPVLHDTSLAMRRALRRVVSDTAVENRLLRTLSDTSQATRRELGRLLNDTSLATRRAYLRQFRAVVVRYGSWISLEGEASEVLTEDRVALRSPVSLRVEGEPTMHGIAEVSMPRRGEMATWLVVYAANRRTRGVDETAERMLASFRVTPDPASTSP